MQEKSTATENDNSVINVLGLEDTPRGLLALVDARRFFRDSRVNIVPVFVTHVEYNGLDEYLQQDGRNEPQYVTVGDLQQLLDNDTILESLLKKTQ